MVKCVRCGKPITADQKSEAYSFVQTGLRIHSTCVGELLRELLALMAKLPEDLRCEPAVSATRTE